MELFNLTAHELSKKLADKEISSVELTKSVLDRIEKIESNIGGYITVDKEGALESAKRADDMISDGKQQPLTGIPVAIKDNICTNGLKTTCASKMLYNFVPPYDAFAAKKLKDDGAVILGKANMDEFAMGSSTETSYFKKTHNPYGTNKVPGGSSGGSAAVVAADEAIFALGSDTGGSIRQPSSFCSVVGLKPTYGLVSRFGLVAFASSLDQIGPLTKDVEDCALVLNTITGHDSADSTSLNIDYPDYTKTLKDGVEGLKIGIPLEYIGDGISDDVKNAINSTAKQFEKMGAHVETFNMPYTDYALAAYYIISSAEASSNLARFDGVKYGYRTENFDDLTDMYLKTRSEGFGDEVKRRIMLGTYVLSSGYYDAYYKKAQKTRTLIRGAFADAFKKYDIILSPAVPSTAFNIGEKISDPLEMYLGDICTVSVNIAGLPAIVLPGGFGKDGMPIGIQLIGKAFSEPRILSAAYAFEQNTDYHTVKPRI